MPNFLGSSSSFAKEFAAPINKSHRESASAEDIFNGIEQLKMLHQQVLPFILRREKDQVLKELPPKIITTIPCEMSTLQRQIYDHFSCGSQAKKCFQLLQSAIKSQNGGDSQEDCFPRLGAETLKTLLFLRLLCTHPILATSSMKKSSCGTFSGDLHDSALSDISSSGKLVALLDLLRECGVYASDIVAADNDSSLIYCHGSSEVQDEADDVSELMSPNHTDNSSMLDGTDRSNSSSKCLIFAQFSHSLDVVEEMVLKKYMPAVPFLRLDGRVPDDRRAGLVQRFNEDDSIKIMLLTTRVGGLGLNLTGMSRVLLEGRYQQVRKQSLISCF